MFPFILKLSSVAPITGETEHLSIKEHKPQKVQKNFGNLENWSENFLSHPYGSNSVVIHYQ